MKINREDTRFGIFREEREYAILARFSNGVGFIQEDSSKDVRGLAIKVLAVHGERVPFLESTPSAVNGERVPPLESTPYHEQHTQDFLMTNNPTQLASTAEDFMEFGKIQDSFPRAFLLMKKWRSMSVGRCRIFFETSIVSSTSNIGAMRPFFLVRGL